MLRRHLLSALACLPLLGSGFVSAQDVDVLPPSRMPVPPGNSPIHVHVHNWGYNPFSGNANSNPYSYGWPLAMQKGAQATQDWEADYQRRRLYQYYKDTNNLQAMEQMDRNQQPISPTDPQIEKTNKIHAPMRLNAGEFDRTSGAITWPKLLSGPEYAPYRKHLDALFKAWAASPSSGYGSVNYHQIQSMASALNDEFSGHEASIAVNTPKQYVYAEQFIRGLAYEAGFPPDAKSEE